MAGIYFHIPFCKQACHYCDFHFSTALKYKGEMLRAMHQELRLQAPFLGNEPVKTLYFGGGTPSLLDGADILRLIEETARYFDLSQVSEITLEANPDDLNGKKISTFKETPINRFSLGIQSFHEEDLRWMNRAHNAQEAERAIKQIQDAGFAQITADLIYGYPLLTDEKWQANLEQVLHFQLPHLSAYSMTVEGQTALAHSIRKGLQKPMDEEQSARQFLSLMDRLQEAGYEHYEISNFALPGQYALHNTNYWKAAPYLGIGPSAHSFYGQKRQWNISHNLRYMAAINAGLIPAEEELLSTADQVNEYLMTSLRTMWGINLKHLEQRFGSFYRQTIEKEMQPLLTTQKLQQEGTRVRLTRAGKLMADALAADLFVE